MKKSTNFLTKPITFNPSRTTRMVMSTLLIVAGVTTTTWLIIARCSASSDLSSHGRGAFTEAEKTAMMTRSAPPREAMEAMAMMAKVSHRKPGAKFVSPWAKPQPDKP